MRGSNEKKEFWCVKTEVYKDGTFNISMFKKNSAQKPLFSQQSRFEMEVYHDWFDTQIEAEGFIDKKTRLYKIARDGLLKNSEEDKTRPIRGECLLTAAEVARRLTVSVKEVYNLSTQNILRPHRIQGVLRFDDADINDYIFFSKYHDNFVHLKQSDAKEFLSELNTLIEDQITHTKDYIEKVVFRHLKRRQA